MPRSWAIGLPQQVDHYPGPLSDSRWRDHANVHRAGFVLFELLAQHNDYNARVVEEVKTRPART